LALIQGLGPCLGLNGPKIGPEFGLTSAYVVRKEHIGDGTFPKIYSRQRHAVIHLPGRRHYARDPRRALRKSRNEHIAGKRRADTTRTFRQLPETLTVQFPK